MDERMNKAKQYSEKENQAVESASKFSNSSLYKMLPQKDGLKFDNRIIVILWKPAIVVPEIFEPFLDPDYYDYKAALKVHYIRDNEDNTQAIYCQPQTAKFYSEFLERDFPQHECEWCAKSVPATLRYAFQVFDYQKLIGEREFDKGETRPQIQAMIGPGKIYTSLHNKVKVGKEFWDKCVVMITRDTTKGLKFSDYSVEVEENPPTDMLNNESLMSYLRDEANLVNFVKEDIVRLAYAIGEGKSEAPITQTGPQQDTTAKHKPEEPEVGKRKINW